VPEFTPSRRAASSSDRPFWKRQYNWRGPSSTDAGIAARLPVHAVGAGVHERATSARRIDVPAVSRGPTPRTYPAGSGAIDTPVRAPQVNFVSATFGPAHHPRLRRARK